MQTGVENWDDMKPLYTGGEMEGKQAWGGVKLFKGNERDV